MEPSLFRPPHPCNQTRPAGRPGRGPNAPRSRLRARGVLVPPAFRTWRRPWSEAEPQRKNHEGEERIPRAKAATTTQSVLSSQVLNLEACRNLCFPEPLSSFERRRGWKCRVPGGLFLVRCLISERLLLLPPPLLAGRLERIEEGWTGVSGPRSGFCGQRRFLPASSCAAL